MKVFIVKFFILTLFFSNIVAANPNKAFLDLVNYTASIDGYSSLCVKNYNDEQESANLFILLDDIKKKYLLITDDDYNMLRSSYIKTKSATINQLSRLKLNSQKNMCGKYLKIFERFDKKKQKSLDDLEEMINVYQ
ncbi:MAG: hypothetical protein ISQ60_01310 [Gammaproteobacteria bacterium]|nr:hypothetical protein [Gammaproteobacteria bacterium]MBL6818931.1 hypothetical protein [Gammaproteobacteria bacterium]MBL6898704.1 hypothetical protein [Gammaproteobacteria bacterium]